MSTLLQDLRFALRSFRKSPGFSVIAVSSLALGIGANTAIFSLMDQILLRLLPIREPERIVQLDSKGANQGMITGQNTFSYLMYKDLRDRNSVFDGLVARFPASLSLTWREQTERVTGELVSGNFFEVLGVQPYRGRLFEQGDDMTPGAHPVAVLSHAFWRRKFGADNGVINQKVLINGAPYIVVGVSAPGFKGIEVGQHADVFVPTMMKAAATPTWNGLDNRRVMWLQLFGRLKPGLSPTEAQASLQVLYSQVLESSEIPTLREPSARFLKEFRNKKIEILEGARGTSNLREDAQVPLLVLSGMVGLVLLIACANVANLLTARASGRQKEIAIRLSLGASPFAIIRQLLTESFTLALVGGAFALLVAVWAGDVLLSFLPFEQADLLFSTVPDARVLAFNFAITLLAALIFGLIPALQAARPAIATTLKSEASSVVGGSGQLRFRKALIVAQIALSLLLLVGAGLFARSLYNLKALDPGFNAQNLVTFSIDPSLNGYNPQRAYSFMERLRKSLEAMPGARSASMATTGLMTGDRSMSTVRIEGYQSKEGEDMNPDVNYIGPGFFRTLGMSLVSGREFTERDTMEAPHVAVINESMVKKYFGTSNPLGRRLGFGRNKDGSRAYEFEIVGVVKDQRGRGLREEAPRFVYIPTFQDEHPAQLSYYVRTSQAPDTFGTTIRRQLAQLDANLPLTNMKSMTVQVNQSIFVERLIAMLSAFFGLLATVLAAIGLYGVMSYSISRRTREIGIRMALGAERHNVLWLVMKEVLLLAAIGMVIGLPSAVGLGRYFESELFGLKAADPLTLTLSTLLLGTVALLAGYIPARRAAYMDPIRALRYE